LYEFSAQETQAPWVHVTFFDGALHLIFTGTVVSLVGQLLLLAFGSQRPLNCLVTAWPNDEDPLHDEAPFLQVTCSTAALSDTIRKTKRMADKSRKTGISGSPFSSSAKVARLHNNRMSFCSKVISR
jgi:hypothetical protein